MSNKVFEEYKKRSKGDEYANGWVGEGHAAVMAYAKAIQEAGSTETQAVISALESIKFETVCGTRYFRKDDHQAMKPLQMYRLRGTKKNAVGFEVLEYIKMPAEDFADPATPGKPLAFKYVKV
jgi:branched-chain amino acid transport system substrate-binding protein